VTINREHTSLTSLYRFFKNLGTIQKGRYTIDFLDPIKVPTGRHMLVVDVSPRVMINTMFFKSCREDRTLKNHIALSIFHNQC